MAPPVAPIQAAVDPNASTPTATFYPNASTPGGGDRGWTAPYPKIMAHELEGNWCHAGFLMPWWAAGKIVSEGEDRYTETGFAIVGAIPFPICDTYTRIPNTNAFKDQCGTETQTWKQGPQGLSLESNNCLEFCASGSPADQLRCWI